MSARGKPVTLQDREDKLLPELQNQCHSVHNLYQHVVLMPQSSIILN